jgi:hypothetical protein
MSKDAQSVSEWRKCQLGVNVEALRRYDIIECLRFTLAAKHGNKNPRPMSEEIRKARDALADDPHSMYWINELGRIYAKEAQWDKCEIALLRGWKRAGEIQDSEVRFHFLMKLCEASYNLEKYRQALAVLNDIEEPQGALEQQALLIMTVRVKAANQDAPGALKAFTKLVDSEDFGFGSRMLAVTMFDLRKAGAYEPAKYAVEKMAGPCDPKSMLSMLDEAAVQQKSPAARQEELTKYFVGGGVALSVLLLGIVLYFLEQWSLGKWAESGKKM